MALTINGGQGSTPPGGGPGNKRGYKAVKSEDFSPDKFEVYGRLDLNLTEIAQLEQITAAQASAIMRSPALRQAYDLGRSQCIVALRQKVVSLALAGDTRILPLAVTHFGNLTEDRERGIPEHYDPGQHSWDGAFKNKLEALRQKYLGGEPDEDEATGE